MAKLVAAMDADELKGKELIAAVQVLLQDRWHQERMAQREKRLRIQTIYAKASIKLRLKAIGQHKKIANKRLAVAASKAKAEVEKYAPLPIPRVTFESVSPSASQIALRDKFGIAPGGVVFDSRAQAAQSNFQPDTYSDTNPVLSAGGESNVFGATEHTTRAVPTVTFEAQNSNHPPP
jgi:hypothetical protein